ncbi:MAG: AI-2E family transporter [Gemmatimonadota bacterium]
MKPLTAMRDWRLAHGIAVLLVFGIFLWELGDVLSPVPLFLALLVLMVPYAGSPFHRLLILTTGVLMGLWLLADLGTLVAPFVLAFVLAYILDPLVDRMVRLRLPRAVAILLLALPVLVAIGLLVFLGIPALARQVQSLIERAPELVERIVGWIDGLRAGIIRIDLPFVDERALAERLESLEPAAVTAFLQEQQRAIAAGAWEAVLGLGRGLGTVATVLGYVVLTPVLTFYLLRDWDGIVARMSGYIPRPRYEGWSRFSREYDRLLSRYLRGQLLAAAIVGVLTWIGLWIAGFPYSGLVGAVAGVFNIVPYLGLVVSLVPALIIAILSGSFLASVLKIVIVFGFVQFLDGNIIGPRIVGESVGLHPVWVMLAIALAGFFLGFVGLLLAIPAAILVKLLLEAGLERYRSSAMYLGAPEG